jgi:uncharacterized protein
MPAESRPPKLGVVIDTNVLVSGLTFPGRPREVLDLVWKGDLEAYISPFILVELENTLAKDFGWGKEQIDLVLAKIRSKKVLVHPQIRLSIVKGKDDDNRILECAVESKASYLITGDKKHLLPLKQYQGIRILPPAEFLGLF